MPKLKKTYPDYLGTGGGVFTDLETNHAETFAWLNDIGALLDAEYFGNHSGNKETSSLIDDFIETNTEAEEQYPLILKQSQRTLIANIIANKYANKWTRLYNIMSVEYNPIENYSMTEEEEPDITHTHSASEDYEVSDTRTNAFKSTLKDEPTNNYEVTDTITKEIEITRTETPSEDYEVKEETSKSFDITKTEIPSNDYEVSEEKSTNTNLTVETTSGTTSDVYGFNSTAPVPANEATGNSTVETTGDALNNKETIIKSQTGSLTLNEAGDAEDNVETVSKTQTGSITTTEAGSAENNIETSTHTQTGYITRTEEGNANDNIETNTRTQTGSTIDTETGTRTTTRSGNIGVTTTQQMIESEIALWQWNFFEMIFKDVDTVLTSPKYNI